MPARMPFDVDVVMARVAEVVQPFPKAAMFELAEEGFATPFEQAVACIISARTLEEVTLPTARRLFTVARSPAAIAALTLTEIDALIHASSFHEAKARQIHGIAKRAMEEFGGIIPCDETAVLALPGIGPKCASLVLGIACNQPRIAVDIHVHRVTNRWGYVDAPTPEATMTALAAKLPPKYWIEINRVLVPFGKYLCTGRLPRCSTCPVRDMCQQRGIADYR